MQRARWSRPSCIVMPILFAVALALAWLVSGSALRTPNPASVTKETPA